MWWTVERANAVTGGIWLLGLGILFATDFWWPGILVLAGIATIVQGSARPGGWKAIHGGLGMLVIAGWAVLDFSIVALFVGMGVYAIGAALIRPAPIEKKPVYDHSLE